MDKKYQFLVIGILSGIAISALFLLAIGNIKSGRTARQVIISTITPAKDIVGNNQGGIEGKINLNDCTAQDLEELPGIGSSKAGAIIRYRETYGKFQSLEELTYVPGIGESLYMTIKDFLYIGD